MKQRLILLMLALTLPLLALPAQAQETPEAQTTLVVFAASSLTNTLEDVALAFETEHPDVDVAFNFAASSTLATQLVEGAPADIFASANVNQMNVAVEGERIAGEPQIFAENRLVVVVPFDNPADITDLDDLANPGVQLVLAAPAVPVRDYTDAMLEKLAADPDYGEAYRDAVLNNLVSEEDNVRQVSAKVALGEADAGVVYLSDVTPDIQDQVMVVPIPDEFNTIASYPIAVTDDTPNPEIAADFVEFVLSDAGQEILESWNFVPVNVPEDEGTPTPSPEPSATAESSSAS